MSSELKILVVSKWGEWLDLAHAIACEGHAVKMAVEMRSCREIGDGFLDKVRDWTRWTDWADLVVFDYTGHGREADQLRARGKPVIGGCEYTDRLELDRHYGQNELKRHKINTLSNRSFDTCGEAIEHIRKHPRSYVIKPSGATQEIKQLLFVGKEDDGSDVIRMLTAYDRTWADQLTGFQLQHRVRGVEVSVAAYFNGKRFVRPVNVTFEHKKLFPGELGVSTGEMGTSMFWVSDCPLFEQTLGRFEATLASHGFTGTIDINCIVNGKGIYPLEFTSRFGYPQACIQRAGIHEPLGALLYRIATGTCDQIRVRKGFQVGAYMVVPPFPYEDRKTFELFSNNAVVLLKKPMKEGIHLQHLKQVNGEWLITGDSGIALLVSGTGLTMREAQKQMYSRIQGVLINHAYYRTDIGDRWTEDSDRLRAWGYL